MTPLEAVEKRMSMDACGCTNSTVLVYNIYIYIYIIIIIIITHVQAVPPLSQRKMEGSVSVMFHPKEQCATQASS